MYRAVLKYLSFGLLAVLAAVLVAGTLLERCMGLFIYSSPWFVALWGAMLVSALLYILKTSMWRAAAPLFLHAAFVVVLAGAFITYLTAERGRLFLCEGAAPSSMFVQSDGGLGKFPFYLSLRGCGVECTELGVPRDYFAYLLVRLPDGGEEVARLSMNRVYDREGFRFYLSAVEGDCATLLVSHDVWGVVITYLGYLLSVVGLISLFVARGTQRAVLTGWLRARGVYISYKLPAGLWRKVFCGSLFFFVIIVCLGVRRWVVTGVFPVTNGAEVMMFIACCSFLSVMLLRHNRNLAVAASCFAMLCAVVALLSGVLSAGSVHPVLRTPLLPLHVVTIVASYVLIALLAVNALVALCVYWLKGGNERLEAAAVYGRVMLYLAVLLLVAGIFLGATWANISWGRYWGWDPKEVWALITLIVCSFGFHTRSLPFMARPVVFHLFCIVAFGVMLFTYLGVNFFLGGLHSYA